jgi:prevent-host-death family protein
MTRVTLLEFRKDAEGILRQVRRGQSVILTRRGRPVARIEPIKDAPSGADDPIYQLIGLTQDVSKSLNNAEMDRLIYGA